MIFDENISPGDLIAVGDIHASWDLYSQLLAWVKDSQARVILLGDIIDRGGDDLIVLDNTKRILEDPQSWGLAEFQVLRGNHEQLFLDFVKGTTRDMVLWVENGANISLSDEMVKNHYSWIAKTPFYKIIEDTLFVHAGVVPGVNPECTIQKGRSEELLWIRKPFLTKGPMFGNWGSPLKRVVHGHSITFICDGGDEYNPLPVVKGDRVNIDTGAFLSDGRLTAYNVTKNAFYQFSRY